ncbi:hypothetical protein HGRIS_005147 [Hohenbuehelia grisea]|uniref:Uncharacterized protein n=1 Tax=Hohenbuehelia grisea TaxID=104357 RepID=A0ABR3JE51_9AGAR
MSHSQAQASVRPGKRRNSQAPRTHEHDILHNVLQALASWIWASGADYMLEAAYIAGDVVDLPVWPSEHQDERWHSSETTWEAEK